MTNRHESIRYHLNLLEKQGRVRDWYSYRPGKDKLWSVQVPGTSYTFTVREVEAFIKGATI